MYRLAFILLLLSFCLYESDINKELEQYYKKGNFLKIIEFIQKTDLENSEENYNIILWKARIYSLYPETYGLSKLFYKKYLKKNISIIYYKEFLLFLLDIRDMDEILYTIDGENIAPELMLHSDILDFRNCIECILNIEKKNYLNSFNQVDGIQDPFLKNYCLLNLIYNLIFIESPVNLILPKTNKIENYIDLSSIEKIEYTTLLFSNFLGDTKLPKTNKQTIELILKTLEKYLNTNLNTYLNKNFSQLCTLQKNFPNTKLCPLSLEECKTLYPDNISLYRDQKSNKVFLIPIETYLKNQIYIPTVKF